METKEKLSGKELEYKIEAAAKKYSEFMDIIYPEWKEDVNSIDTPMRVAKMFVTEIFSGLWTPPPKITSFKNAKKYPGLIFEGNIPVKSICAHHHMPIFGVAHLAYLPDIKEGHIIGLSKLNRIVEFLSRRPQVQENLTSEIHNYLEKLIGPNLGVAVTIKARHLCVAHRGVNHNSLMVTTELSGAFRESSNLARVEFFDYIKTLNEKIIV